MRTGNNHTFKEDDTGSLVGNRFILGIANKTIATNQTATFIYVTGLTVGGTGAQSLWVLIGST